MKKYECKECGYVYNPEEGMLNRISSSNLVRDVINSYSAPVTPRDDSMCVEFDRLAEDWVCPRCGAGKDKFEPN